MARRFATASETPRERAHRRRLVESMSFEIVPLNSAEAAIAALPPSSTVSITCSPVKGIDATLELTGRIRSAGHDAVPHLAARMVESDQHVERIASWLRTEAVTAVFVVGGDAEAPLGPFHDGLGFLRALLDAGPDLAVVGVPGYPDGHPVISDGLLHDALHAKQDLLAEAGVAGYVSTQMCFDAARIDGWLRRERDAGLGVPVHLGIAGVVDRTRLVTMGARLGVGASLRYLRKNRRAIGRLLSTSHYDPNKLLEPLSPALEPLGVDGIHCFTFNQVEATARWQGETLASL
jgi:methylenetetrahydrofolate reductase (NADPH)